MSKFAVETYVEDWTCALPDEASEVWALRVDLERRIHKMRLEILDDEKYRRVRDPHSHLRKTSQDYRAYVRLATRLNLLLRYYGFEGGRRRTSAMDFIPALYRIAHSIDDLSPEERLLLEWVSMFVEEKTGDKIQSGDFMPDTSKKLLYSEIRSEVLANFTGQERDLDMWDERPEKWVASDEWHTERIRRQREERLRDDGTGRVDDFEELDRD